MSSFSPAPCRSASAHGNNSSVVIVIIRSRAPRVPDVPRRLTLRDLAPCEMHKFELFSSTVPNGTTRFLWGVKINNFFHLRDLFLNVFLAFFFKIVITVSRHDVMKENKLFCLKTQNSVLSKKGKRY